MLPKVSRELKALRELERSYARHVEACKDCKGVGCKGCKGLGYKKKKK